MIDLIFDSQQLFNATDCFSPATLIGKGSHGSVYKAILHDNSIVAVKKPSHTHLHLFPHNNSILDNEARFLSSLRHNPLVVNFLGISFDPSRNIKLLVMEFMPNGSLHHLLLSSSQSPPLILTWPKRFQIISQIARAVHSLHHAKPFVIHRDIKAENILFDSDWNLKLADFGLAVSQNDSLTRPAGTIGYLDPSYTTPTKLSTKTDVFSFGVVVLEIMSGRKAMDVSKSPASIIEWAIPLIEAQRFQQIYDKRIALPKHLEGTARKLFHVAARCLSPNQGNRPSMAEIVNAIEIETSCCSTSISTSIERVKCPGWSSLLKSMVLLMIRKRRRLGKQWKMLIKCWRAQAGDDPRGILGRKLLLREVVAE